MENQHIIDKLIKTVQILTTTTIFLALFAISLLIVLVSGVNLADFNKNVDATEKEDANRKAAVEFAASVKVNEELNSFWSPEDIYKTSGKQREVLDYGKNLIAHTAQYLGPKGSVSQITNGMNCQNCHLDAGTKIWGNNYGGVASTYPKYRPRSGKMEDLSKRINDCMERSLNGKALAENSNEMNAIKAYIEYIGKGVKKGEKGKGAGIYDLAFLDRPASPVKGKAIFAEKCQSCHQANGEGLLADNKIEYTYPPLWGEHSYNQGAGLYRMSRLAGYVKYNMPQGATFQNPQLSDEEAWDIAAFINAQPRPSKDLSADWPKMAEKPIDHPFGPYADAFSENQHKFGVFQPIVAEKKRQKEAKAKAN
jgi:thiosulfate dehydrogenase